MAMYLTGFTVRKVRVFRPLGGTIVPLECEVMMCERCAGSGPESVGEVLTPCGRISARLTATLTDKTGVFTGLPDTITLEGENIGVSAQWVYLGEAYNLSLGEDGLGVNNWTSQVNPDVANCTPVNGVVDSVQCEPFRVTVTFSNLPGAEEPPGPCHGTMTVVFTEAA